MPGLGAARLGRAAASLHRLPSRLPLLSRRTVPVGRCGIGFDVLGHRGLVSFAAVLDKAESVLACYALVQGQLKPQVKEEPGPGEGKDFKHALSWSWDGKEINTEATGRSKKQARNAAARDLLQQLAKMEPEWMDPTRNGALAQWAVDWINQKVQATVELDDAVQQEEMEEQEAPAQGSSITHRYIWTCPQLGAESFQGTATASTAAESRWQAMSDLYQNLPSQLDDMILALEGSAKANKQVEAQRLASRVDEELAGKINSMHNLVVQRLGIRWKHTFQTHPQDGSSCTLRWDYFDESIGKMQSMETHGQAGSKVQARAQANAEMLHKHGHIPLLGESFREKLGEVRRSLAENKYVDVVNQACDLMSSEESTDTWSFFVPDVLRAALAEGDEFLLRQLLEGLQSNAEVKGGVPPELWERLLDEASFAMRHYHAASMSLAYLQRLPLKEAALPGHDELTYFVKFRHLLSMERHGGLLHGIQEYELDPRAFLSVPTVDVHRLEADMVVLTTTPGAGMDIIDSSRPLKAGDIVLLVPMEAIAELEGFTGSGASEELEQPPAPEAELDLSSLGDGETLASGWRHPEAWIASVTSIKGQPHHGEPLQVRTRRISQFGSDAETLHMGTPIALGRQYRMFYLAMETPMGRMLSAVRCLCQVRFPAWSDEYEGRKPSYNYRDEIRRLLLAGTEEARTLALEAPRMPASAVPAEEFLEKLYQQKPALEQLTESQRNAVKNAMEQRLSLIQGPPGTGKTHVACAIIAAWVERYARNGERILAVADSNVAADNLHTRLAAFGISSVRVGMGKEVETLLGDKLWQAVRAAQVVVATCIGSGMDALDSKGEAGSYQRVVIDECTQACEPSAIISLGRNCEQAVLIGDHAQLPATVLSKLAKRDGLGVSLFERMVDTNGLEPTVLTEQRRMHSSIAEFPNIQFYNSRLVNAVDDASLAPIPGFQWPNPDCRVCFVDVSADGGGEGKHGFSTYNTSEAECIAQVLQGILNAGFPPHDLCVLTPYQAQRNEILRALREAGLWSDINSISIDTIDGYQGMERDLVLFSATRSNSERSIGFLADSRRMNVMLTRARRGVIVFGNAETLRFSSSMQSRWGAWYQWAEDKGAVTNMAALTSPDQASATTMASATVDSGSPAMSAGSSDDVGHESGADQSHVQAESPEEFGLPLPPPPSMPSPAPNQVWEKVFSEEYGQFYYWEKVTGRTQWELPEGFAQ